MRIGRISRSAASGSCSISAMRDSGRLRLAPVAILPALPHLEIQRESLTVQRSGAIDHVDELGVHETRRTARGVRFRKACARTRRETPARLACSGSARGRSDRRAPARTPGPIRLRRRRRSASRSPRRFRRPAAADDARPREAPPRCACRWPGGRRSTGSRTNR